MSVCFNVQILQNIIYFQSICVYVSIYGLCVTLTYADNQCRILSLFGWVLGVSLTMADTTRHALFGLCYGKTIAFLRADSKLWNLHPLVFSLHPVIVFKNQLNY